MDIDQTIEFEKWLYSHTDTAYWRSKSPEYRAAKAAWQARDAELAELQAELAQMKDDWKVICDAAESMPAGTIEFRQKRKITEMQVEVEAANRVAAIAVAGAGKHAERVVELESEVSTLRESLKEVNRLLSLNSAEVSRLKSCQMAWQPIETAPKGQILVCGGTYHDNDEDAYSHVLEDVAIVYWYQDHWRGDQLEGHDRWFIHEPKYWMHLPSPMPSAPLCEDCPPVDYPTDRTRCAPCPRRAQPLDDASIPAERDQEIGRFEISERHRSATEQILNLTLALQDYMDACSYADKDTLISAIAAAHKRALELVPRRVYPSQPLPGERPCECKHSDSWRCANARGITTLACHCACHQLTGEQTPHPLASRCYVMSQPHLSGWYLVIGFNTVEEVQAAQQFVSGIHQLPRDPK